MRRGNRLFVIGYNRVSVSWINEPSKDLTRAQPHEQIMSSTGRAMSSYMRSADAAAGVGRDVAAGDGGIASSDAAQRLAVLCVQRARRRKSASRPKGRALGLRTRTRRSAIA